MADPVTVVDYDPNWPTQFERLKERVARSIPEFVLRIEHVGSTAVTGLAAKPSVDLIIQLDDTAQLAIVIQRLGALGYRHEGDLGVAGREAFAVPPGEARHHLYVCLPGCAQLAKQVAFRDYLRAHEGARTEYAALKCQLAKEHRNDRTTYTEAKAGFVARVLARASEIPAGQ
jgi:GrpB-like predicted nucleotidyltransferase (UPF0157 family)